MVVFWISIVIATIPYELEKGSIDVRFGANSH